MFQFQRDAVVKRVGKELAAKRGKIKRGQANIIARKAIRSVAGITHEPDVKRLATEICKEVGKHGNKKQAGEKSSLRAAKALRDKIAL